MSIVTTLVMDDDLRDVADALGVKPRTNPMWVQMDFGVAPEGYHWRDVVIALARRVQELEAVVRADGSGTT